METQTKMIWPECYWQHFQRARLEQRSNSHNKEKASKDALYWYRTKSRRVLVGWAFLGMHNSGTCPPDLIHTSSKYQLKSLSEDLKPSQASAWLQNVSTVMRHLLLQGPSASKLPPYPRRFLFRRIFKIFGQKRLFLSFCQAAWYQSLCYTHLLPRREYHIFLL